MALPIRQGATHKVVIGPVVAVGDGFTPVTTLALSTADEAEVILHDNATVVDISAYTFAAVTTADGYYQLTLQTGISNTVGHMTVVINDDSLCLPVRMDFTVLDTAPYDAMYKDAATMDVNTITVSGTAQTANDNGLDINAILADTADMQPKIGTPVTNVSADIAAVQADTDDIQTRLPTALVGGLMSSDVTAISTDTVAADNLELQYDTTGIVGDQFPATQSQLSGIANVGSAVHKPASTYLLTTGPIPTGVVSDTQALDAIYHTHAAITGGFEIYYEFLIGSGTPSSVQVTGFVNGNNDTILVRGFDWNTATWIQIGTINGTNSTVNQVGAFDMFVNMVGSGVDLGKVRVQFFAASGLTAATLAIDQIFIAFSQGTGAYNGAIHVDTNASNTNTVPGVDGLDTNPVSTWAAALTLSASVGLNSFAFAGGSSITLTGNSDSFQFRGQAYSVALGGQSIDGAFFFGATVTGTGTTAGTHPVFEDCPIGTISLPPTIMRRCFIFGDITNTGVGDWFINHCMSRKAGGAAFKFNFGTAVGNTNLNMRLWAGRVQLEAMGDTGTDAAEIEGWGEVVEGTCTAGMITISGNLTIASFVNLSLTDDARIDVFQINAEVDTAIVDGALATASALATVDGNVDSILLDTAEIGIAGIGLTDINLPNQTMNITGNLSGSVGSLTGHTVQTGDTYALANGVAGFVAIDTVVDSILAMLDDPRAEPVQGTPAVNADAMTKVDYIYKFLRNKVETTATTVKVYDDAGTVVDHKKTISDDGTTYTSGEVITGP